MEGSFRYSYEKSIKREEIPSHIPAVTTESFLSHLEEKISIVKDSRERTKLVAEEVETVFSGGDEEKRDFFLKLPQMLLGEHKQSVLEILNILFQTTVDKSNFLNFLDLLSSLKTVGEKRYYHLLAGRVAEFVGYDQQAVKEFVKALDVSQTKNAAVWLIVFDDIIKDGIQGDAEMSRIFFEEVLGTLTEKVAVESTSALSRRKAKAILKRSSKKVGETWSIDEIKSFLEDFPDFAAEESRKEIGQMNDEELRRVFEKMIDHEPYFYDIAAAEDFVSQKEGLEKRYRTKGLKVWEFLSIRTTPKKGTVEKKQLSTRYLFLPISREYYGVYSDMGTCIAVFPKGKKKYDFEESVELKEALEKKNDSQEAHEAVEIYHLFLDHDVLEDVEKDYNFPIRELTAREQMWFINSLKNYTEEDEKVVTTFTQKFGLAGARAFLSCEFGDRFRQTVLDIGEKFPEELARQVFEQYGKLALLAQEKADKLIKEFTAEGKEVKVRAADVEQELLKRAKDFLVEMSKASEHSPDAVQAKLEQYETDMVVFAGIFKAAFKGAAEVNLEEVRGLKLESQGIPEITPEDQKAMLAIFEENWRAQKPDSAEFLIQGLKDKLASQDAGSNFYLLKKDGKLIAFVRFDDIEDIDGGPALYGASFNIKKDLRGSAMGEAVMKNTIDAEAAEKTIVIDVFPELQAGTKYVEDFKFVITGVREFPTGVAGKTETRLIMKRDDRVNSQYRKKPAGAQVKSFDLFKGTAELVETVKAMAEQGMVGTEFRADPENKNLRYIVFEPEAKPEVLAKAA